MFDTEFYPTPKSIIKKMIKPFINEGRSNRYHDYLPEGLTILEPSAGKGDIIDYIKEEYDYHNRAKVYCCESDPELKHILQDKGYRVIADDFLTYTGDYLFDLVIMNPPFSNGDKHLLKAWDVLECGDIACLLNSETILNPYTESREYLVDLISKYGSYEFIGNVFSTAERKSDVDVVLVRLRKESTATKFDFEFKSVFKDRKVELDEKTFTDPIATRDVIGNMILQYNELKNWYVKWLEAREALTFYQQQLTTQYTSSIKLAEESLSKKKSTSYNSFCDSMKQEIWSVVMDKTNIEKYMTFAVRQNFQKFSKAQGYMDFNKENVASLVQMIFENRYDIMEKAVVDVFNMFTEHHEENRYMVEGWKTNNKYKVNKKIIIPYGVSYDEKWGRQYGAAFESNHRRWDRYSDIDKVMCYLSGVNYDTMPGAIDEALKNKFRIIGKIRPGDKFDNTTESYFFKLKFWKKGTLHLEFKDDKLWQEFNLRACVGKMWLSEEEMKVYRERNMQNQQEPEQVKYLST